MNKNLIKKLNDELRITFSGGQIIITTQVQLLPAANRNELFCQIKKFNKFTKANDPYGEHDFGSIEYNGWAYFWKIDYFDIDFLYLSPDPSDSSVTNRVLTIMRADEY